jgi:hypothetical protein
MSKAGESYSGKGFAASVGSAALDQGINISAEQLQGGAPFQDWLSQRTPDEFNRLMGQLGLTGREYR